MHEIREKFVNEFVREFMPEDYVVTLFWTGGGQCYVQEAFGRKDAKNGHKVMVLRHVVRNHLQIHFWSLQYESASNSESLYQI